ncbi:MAG: ribonuclease [Oscillospiraceae bacterium]|nr:ribonuclease [Oscillospiraceae bacterium]
MKQKLFSILLTLSALTLAACGGADNISDAVVTYLPELTANDTVDSPSQEDTAVPEDAAAPEDDPGTTAGTEDVQWEDPAAPELDEDGTYNSKEDVSLYLHLYDHLPSNYITKNEARDLGWSGGSVEVYAPGCAIGGDRFGNREGLLPKAEGRTYYECDIDTIGQSSRGAKRIIFSNDGLVYYTEDHYESFTQLYGEE